MGMKLKSGADLCGFELSRFCVQNDVAIPDAPASGRKYFHTGTGMEGKYSLLGRERIYTGTAWRAVAYVDDLANLDITSNADYLALKERVDAFLDGEVDSNGVLDNLKEIQKFLDNYSSATDLTDILDTKLDKKGGTIETNSEYYPLILATSAELGQTGIKGKIGTTDIGAFVFSEGNTYLYNYKSKIGLGIYDGIAKFGSNTLLHSGNVGDYALKTDGSNAMKVGIKFNVFNIDLNVGLGDGIRLIDRSGANGPTGTTWWQTFSAVGSNGGFQFATFPSHEKSLVFLRTCGNSESSWKDWREIAFTDSTVEAATKLATPRTIWGQLFDGTGNIENAHLNIYQHPSGATSDWVRTVRALNSSGMTLSAFGFYGSSETLNYTYIGTNYQSPWMLINPSGNVTIGSSDLAGTSATAKLYVDGYVTTKDGVVINAADAYNSYWEKGFLFSSNSALNAGLWGYGYKSLEYLYLGFGNYSAAVGIRINENGNVLIGKTTDNGKRLQVNGMVYSTEVSVGDENNSYGKLTWSSSGFYDILSEAGNALRLGVGGNRVLNISTGGNVGIGVTSPSAQLHVANDIVANGTIACKGVAAEGSAPVGTVDKWAGSIATGTKSQTYTHALGTTDITVAIYEKNGNEWVQILTDVDVVNANTIRVAFGANTTVEHRIVVMG